jgi:hypothetical protein
MAALSTFSARSSAWRRRRSAFSSACDVEGKGRTAAEAVEVEVEVEVGVEG